MRRSPLPLSLFLASALASTTGAAAAPRARPSTSTAPRASLPEPPACEPRGHADYFHLAIRDARGREHPLDFSLKTDCIVARHAWIADAATAKSRTPVCGCRQEGPYASTFTCLLAHGGGEVDELRVQGFSRFLDGRLNRQRCEARREEFTRRTRGDAVPSPEPDEGAFPVIGPFPLPTPTPPGTVVAPSPWPPQAPSR